MKRILPFLLTIALILSISISAFAIDPETYVYEHDNVTIIFDEDTPFSSSVREHIVESLSHDDDNIVPCGLMCTLFGHNYTYGVITTITHEVSDTQPKCLKEIFEVGECSRCGNVITTLISMEYIVCCP